MIGFMGKALPFILSLIASLLIFKTDVSLHTRAINLCFDNDFEKGSPLLSGDHNFRNDDGACHINIASLMNFFNEVVPETTPAARETTICDLVLIVPSLIVWKMCEALDLKAKFVPLLGTTVLPRTPHRGLDPTTTAPVEVKKIEHLGFIRLIGNYPESLSKGGKKLHTYHSITISAIKAVAILGLQTETGYS
ncbi:hypothetical protein TNIN_10591 [Trichonephila inaurata madagascariensis]|uniref:Uncharacterized protein n=1 Tax=Trichonephila inaurata madagascariensis TaxID=2747483 RepID=A0A8X6IWG6_9ARAC|nr:hypothetical protein TNIN_10591 [Trichonephila inaurata madagascariensis]